MYAPSALLTNPTVGVPSGCASGRLLANAEALPLAQRNGNFNDRIVLDYAASTSTSAAARRAALAAFLRGGILRVR
jgi:hypothetical protein